MVSQTTQKITVSAESIYQQQYSAPVKKQYVYAYRIRIENKGNQRIQLLSRAWEVMDSTGAKRCVEGEGVVGQKPFIEPGEVYEYTSWVQFETPIGAMRGSYAMQRVGRGDRREMFQVEVPKFMHLAPEVLN